MSKLYLSINVEEGCSRVNVWTTKVRKGYRLDGDLVEKLPALLGSFKSKYTIKVVKTNQQLERDVMIGLSSKIRELGHTIAF
jgi:hypothetical protein